MRTVEMESWTESRLAHHKEMGHAFNVSTDTSRAISPSSVDMKNGVVHASPTSAASSFSGPSDQHYDCEIGRAR